MATHFNAFISYRHSPLDSQIAQRIHRQLERFKIPKAIQKATGIKKIDRIFRDKEELPLSVNLSDDINEALIHSDYLIVICSPRFQQSQWCMREIELFLQTHPIERILIVLAEGEPDDVVPPILTQNREPLCCDYRMKPRKSKAIELPRLVSAILGCRYDDLRQRQRQYKTRRLVALFSAALAASLCLTAYFINTSIRIQKANDDLQAANTQIQAANVQIRENLDQALLNQSQYLSSASTALLESGDRLTAMALVLEALPDQDNARPYLPEAESALTTALSSYRISAETSVHGAFTADGLVEQFDVSDDGMILYIKDARKVVSVWDTVTFQKTATIEPAGFTLEKMYMTPAGNAVFTTKYEDLTEGLACYSPDGKLLWEEAAFGDEFAFLDDRSQIILVKNTLENYEFHFIDTDRGCQSAEPICYPKLDNGELVSGFVQLDYRSDRQIGLLLFQGDYDYLYLLDLQTGAFRELVQMLDVFSEGGQDLKCMGMDNAGNILVMLGDGSGLMNGIYQNFELTSPDRAQILCYDPQTLEEKWRSEIVTHIYSNYRTIEAIPDSDLLLVQNGNTFQVHEAATGKCISSGQTAAIPLTLTVEADYTWGILKNGSYFEFDYENQRCRTTSFTEATLNGAIANRGYFVCEPLSYQVTVYRSVKDDLGVPFEDPLQKLPVSVLWSGDRMMVYSYQYLHMLDTVQRQILWYVEDDTSAWEPVGFSRDGTQLRVWDSRNDQLLLFDVEDGSCTQQALSMDIGEEYTHRDSNIFQDGDRVFYVLEANGQFELRGWDIQTQQQTASIRMSPFCGKETDYAKNTTLLLAAEDHVWFTHNTGLYVMDLTDGRITGVERNITVKPSFAQKEGSRTLLIAAGNRLLLATPDGQVSKRIDLGERKGVSVYCYEDDLLMLADDGKIYRYNRRGELLSQLSLSLYNTFFSDVQYGTKNPTDLYWWETGDGDLIVNAFDAGNIIDCEHWQCRAFVPQLQAYLPEQDSFICSSNTQLYAFSRYSTQEQMQKAREALGDFRLTEAQRKYYGLN